MSYNSPRPCSCGSGLLSYWQFDARGIELCRTCPKCHKERMSHYRAAVLTSPNYYHDEPIDEE